MFGRRHTDADSEGLLALKLRYDQIVAERQSLYNLVDSLTGYCEGLESRIETQRVGIEALENRVTDLEVFMDSKKEEIEFLKNLDNKIDGKEDINETG